MGSVTGCSWIWSWIRAIEWDGCYKGREEDRTPKPCAMRELLSEERIIGYGIRNSVLPR